MFDAMEISASGLFAQRIQMNAIASNIANIETTRTPEGGPYIRRKTIFAPRESKLKQGKLISFKLSLSTTHNAHRKEKDISLRKLIGEGVEVKAVVKDASSGFKMVYNPGHPDADQDGYVAMPNINMVDEVSDMIFASRAYQANVTCFEASKKLATTLLSLIR